jgi:hypothetical protein
LAGGVLVVAIVLSVVGFTAWLARTMADDKNHLNAARTDSSFQLALEDERIADAYALTTQRFQQEISFERFCNLIDQHAAVKGRPGARWSKHQKMPTHKSGSREFTYQTDVSVDGQITSFICVIVEEGRQWRIDSLTFR